MVREVCRPWVDNSRALDNADKGSCFYLPCNICRGMGQVCKMYRILEAQKHVCKGSS